MAFDVREYTKKKRQGLTTQTAQAPSSGGFDVREYTKQKRAQSAVQELGNRVNAWVESANRFANDYNSRFSSREEGKYVADSQHWLAQSTSRKTALDAEAQIIRDMMRQYGDYLDSGWVSNVGSMLQSGSGDIDKLLQYSQQDADFWAQFDPTQEQAAQGITADSLYSQWYTDNSYRQKYAGQSYSQLLLTLAQMEDGEEKNWLDSYTLTQATEDELRNQRDTSQTEDDYWKYQSALNQKQISNAAEILSKTQMAGTEGSILDEVLAVSQLEEGEEKRKRKKVAIDAMKQAGVDPDTYYSLITGDKNVTAGNLFDMLGSAFASGFTGFGASVAGLLDKVLGVPARAIGWDNGLGTLYKNMKHDQQAYQYNTELYKNRMGGGTGLGIAADVVSGIAGALPQALLALVTGGTSAGVTLTENAAMQTGGILAKAGLTTSKMLQNPAYWMSFAQTYANDYEEAIAMGADDLTATFGATISSLINAGLEIGIDGASGIQGLPKDIAEGGNKAIVAWAKSALEEGGEEVMQGFVNNAVAKVLYDSETKLVDPAQMIKEFGLGTAVGGILGGGQVALQTGANAAITAGQNAQTKNIYGRSQQELVAEGLESPEGSQSNVLAQKFQKQLDSGKDLTGKQLRQLIDANEQQFQTEAFAQTQQKIQNRLTELGETGDVETISRAIAKQADGQLLTAQEQAALRSSQQARQVALETESGKTVTAPVAAEKTAWQQDADTVNKQAVAATTAVPENANRGKAHLVTDPEKAVTVKEIAELKNGSAKLLLDDGTVVDAADVEFDNEGEALLYDVVAQMGIPRVSTANVLADGIHLSKAQNMEDYAAGIEEAFRFGQQNIPKQELRTSTYASLLDPGRQDFAYRQGQKMAGKQIARKQANIDAIYEQAKTALAQNGTKPYEHGVLMAEGIEKGTMDKSQRASYNLAEKIAPAVKCDILVYKGGKEWGYYNSKTDTICLNINAKWSQASMMAFTLSHELVHRAKLGSPVKFKTFADFLIREYGKQGSDIEAMIAEQLAAAKEAGIEMTEDEAYEEVICDACQRMLLDTDAGKKLAEFGAQSQQNKNFVKEFGKWLKALLEKLKSIFRNVDPDSLAAREFQKFNDTVKRILADMFVDMSLDAGEKLSTIKAAGMTEKITTGEGGVKSKVGVMTEADIRAVQSIGRKSVNQFSAADIKATERFAQRYWQEMGVKSPFFRAWFGDWRANDQTKVQIANQKGDARGVQKNADTGWDIQVSGQVFNETNRHTESYNVAAKAYLPYINSIVENAVLLDSFGIDPRKPKSHNSLLMHSLYAVADIGNGLAIIKLYVEEMNNPNTENTGKRAYQLQNVEKYQLQNGSSQKNASSRSSTTGNIRTVADLFAAVKQKDTSFNPKPASKVVNPDGTPMVMYHGSPAQFTIFDRKKAKSSGQYGRGFYFTNSQSHAGTYGQQYNVYLNIRNPLQHGAGNVSRAQVRSFLEAVAENEDYAIENYGSYDIDSALRKVMGKASSIDAFQVIQDINATAIGDMVEAAALFNKVNGTKFDGIVAATETVAFYPEQIKSATDNIGTFDGSNPDIRYKVPVASEGYDTTNLHWAIENEIISEEDQARFWEAIAEISKRKYNSFARTKDGGYIIENGTKMMFTDGDFKAPTLSKVIEFVYGEYVDTSEERTRIRNEARLYGSTDKSTKALENMYGPGFVTQYDARNYSAYGRKVGRGERAYRTGPNFRGEGREIRQSGEDRLHSGQKIDRKLPVAEDTSPRALLANAFEGIAQKEAERQRIAEYRENLDALNEQEQKMAGKQIARKQAAAQKARKNAPSAKDAKSGKVQFMQGKQTEDLRSYISKSGKALSAVQETAISTMEKLSAVLGVDFYVYESYEKSGKRLYVDENGTEKPAPSGKYAYNGRIYIDLNAGNTGKGTMLYTVAHELTHFIKQWSPAKFKALANFLVSQYGEHGVGVDELVRKQMSKAEAQGISLTYEEAFEEMVADSMEAALVDGTVVQMMEDLKQQDKTLWQMICDWFKNLVADLKAVTDTYSGYKPDSAEGRMVADMQDVIVILESLYGDALMDAGENFKAAKKVTDSVENNTRIAYSRRNAKVLFKENVFPPFNESHSEAHELAERWSRSENTEGGQRKLISFHNKWYLIESFDDMKYGYQIMRALTKQEYIKEASYYGTITGYQSLQNTSSQNAALLRTVHNDTGRRHSADIDASEHRGANYSFHGMGANQNQRGYTANDNGGDLPGSSVDQQGQNGSSVTNSVNNTHKIAEKFSLRDPSAEAVDKALRQENEKLKEDVQRLRELLKLQRQVTGGTKFTKTSVEAAARYLKQTAGAKGDTKELAQILNSFYEFVATAKDLTWEDVKEQAKSAAQWLQKHVVLESGRGEYAGEVLRTMRTSRISLDDSQKAEAAYRYGSFNDFRKATMGTVIVAKDGVPLDIQWQEWADMYPDIFDAGTTATDMPSALMEVAQSLRNADLSKAEYAYHADMIEQDLIRQVYDSYWRVSTLRTVADSMQKQINVLKAKHYSQMDKLRQTHQEKTEQLKQEYRQRVVDMRSRMTETAEKRAARGKLQKLVLDTVKWITHPAKTDVRCPDFLKKPYSDFLGSIDLSSQRLGKGGDPTKADLRLANAMNQLATALGKVMEAQDPGKTNVEDIDAGYLDLPVNFVAELQSMAQKVTDMMVEGEYVVNTMPAADVRKLSQMIRTLNHAIKEVSRLYANMRFANVEALGTDSMEYMAALGTAQESGGIKDFVTWDNALPFYAFKRFGKGGESVFEGLMDGQDKLAQLAKEIFDFQKKTWTEKEAKAWSEDTHTIELSGGELTLTTADAMSIYCTARRDNNHGLQHLLGGGVRVMGLQKGSKKAQDSHALLTIEDIGTISDSLSARQKEVAEALQEFMSTVCAEWGNEISMKRFLTKDFSESRYFPIESNDENMTVKDPAAQQSDLFRLLNISATKPLTPKANNEVIIRNIFDVFTNHTADMARLNAFGMALLDYMKWFNYRQKTVKENGQIDVRGVRKSMEMAYGKTAGSYVMNLIKDVNGRPSDGGLPSWFESVMRNTKIAMVGSNVRVAALQVTSYPRAALVLSPKNLALGLSKKPNIERAKKYCGIALWKSYGFYDTNISRSLEEQIKGKTNLQQQMIEWSLKGAELGDALTWGCLWNACEYEVAATKQYDIGTEAFYQAVGRKLREVVYSTQVVDSVLTRSQMMRSKNAKTKEISSFMSEPTLSANILMDAGMQFQAEKRRSGSAKTAWQKTGKLIGRAIAVYGIGQISAALVESLFDAWRDDEDDKFRDKYLKALGQNLILDLLPFNKVPIISEFAEALLSMAGVGYFSTDSLYSTAVSQAVSALNTWKSVLNGSSSATVYNGIYKTTRALSSFGGVAVSGAMREAVAMWNNTAGAYNPTWKILQTKRSKTELGELLYVAIVEENDRWIKSVRGEFADSSESTKYLKTAVKEHFAAGELDVDTAVQFLKKHCDMSDSEARASVAYWDHKRENPDSEASSAWFDSYYKRVAGSGISIDTYLAYRSKAKDMDTKEQKLRVIHSLQLTKAQKDALYLAEGWAESGLADTPWNEIS